MISFLVRDPRLDIIFYIFLYQFNKFSEYTYNTDAKQSSICTRIAFFRVSLQVYRHHFQLHVEDFSQIHCLWAEPVHTIISLAFDGCIRKVSSMSFFS